MMAIRAKGPEHFKLYKGVCTKETYVEFMDEVRSKLEIGKTFYLIHDNVSINGRLQTHNVIYIAINLPPYSPFLNPTESVFSKLKAHIRHTMNTMPFIPRKTSEKITITHGWR